ncbi:MAG: NADH-quinone oxidoreductase subunit H, partial [Desulfobacterales bacterium]
MDWLIGFILLIIKSGAVLIALLLVAAYLVLVERKFLARLQIRYGPNRAGKFGLLQPIADAIKMMIKEDIVPEAADRMIFLLAPAVVAFTALLMFAVVPFGTEWTIGDKKIPMVISDLNVGLLFVFAMSS